MKKSVFQKHADRIERENRAMPPEMAAVLGGGVPAPWRAPTLAEAEGAIGEKADRWVARCFELATKFVRQGLAPKGAVAVYGHWRGPIAPGSHFDHGTGLPFVQHGWVLCPDGSVVDPTRWVFEGVAPYVYVGPSDHYDEGGNEWREASEGEAPGFDPDEDVIEITKAVMPSADVWNFVEKLLNLREDAFEVDGYEPGTVTLPQLHWLAHRSPGALGPHALAVYKAICKLGHRALIPIDNLRRVERETRTELPR